MAPDTHYHCPSCQHCARLHDLKFRPSDGSFWLCCTACETDHQDEPVCPAQYHPVTRTQSLAALFAQTMHDNLWETTI